LRSIHEKSSARTSGRMTAVATRRANPPDRYAFAWTRLLILQAAQAAPKPLSMLTTVTPLAQEVSIPNSAAMPENAAP